MSDEQADDLWRDFPRTAIAFETRFATEEDCRAYWFEARWGGRPASAKCQDTRVWTIRGGTTFERADCGHQTSLTSGTALEKTTKPLKFWFRAVFEISSRRNGISAMELQRIMGFGSYKTAWTWLLKRWLLGTHGNAVGAKHPQSYLDEYVFRHNRRRTKGVGRIAARTIERLVVLAPTTMRQIIDDTLDCRRLRPTATAS